MPTNIPYVDEVWNPVVGCSKCSPGCENCYAERLHNQRYKARAEGKNVPEQYCMPFDFVQKIHARLDWPLHWRNPRKILCCSMADLFHPKVPFGLVLKIFGITMVTPWHTYMFLTKRINRVVLFFEWWQEQWRKNPILWGRDALALEAVENLPTDLEKANQFWLDNFDQSKRGKLDYPIPHPQPNVHLGVTICNQKEADEKIPILVEIPAAHRWISFEPLLGEISISPNCFFDEQGNDLLSRAIIGGESGPNRRECKPEWIKSIVEQCDAAGIPWLVKQVEISGKVCHDPKRCAEWLEI